MAQYFEKKFLEVYKPGYIGAILAGTIVDLISKYWVVMVYSYNEPVEVIGDFFRMTLIFNSGFVFGIFPDNAIPSLVATGVAILFLIGYRWKNHDLGNPWGWNLVMMGAFGNFIDKFFVKAPPGGGVRFGFTPGPGEFIGVVDFFDFDWPDFLLFHRWPAFNIADSCVSIGLVILIFTMKLDEEKKDS
ncbi:MAG: lipoprotein signal peptidase [Leptospira sp.]|nr:lipoprotein signal peptidase [Leptospira sp.]